MKSSKLILLFGCFTAVFWSSNGLSLFDKYHLIPSTLAEKAEKADPTTTYIPFVIQPVKDMTDKGQRTEEKEIQGVKWQILALKEKFNGVEHLKVFLYANEKDIGENSFKVTCSFQIISRGGEQPQAKKFNEVTFSKTMLNWGFPDLMKWDEFTDEKKKLVVNDIAILEAEVTIVKV